MRSPHLSPGVNTPPDWGRCRLQPGKAAWLSLQRSHTNPRGFYSVGKFIFKTNSKNPLILQKITETPSPNPKHIPEPGPEADALRQRGPANPSPWAQTPSTWHLAGTSAARTARFAENSTPDT